MSSPFTILGIPGSLRKASFNRLALVAAQQLLPPGATMEIAGLDNIPLFNQDEEATPPEAVAILKQKIRAGDAILIATPEYNHSVPGVLKNAIDWASRPPINNWADKPVALISASPGPLGGARAQYHLRQTLSALNMHAVSAPEVMIAHANQKFDANGNLTDETARKQIQKLLANLIAWTERLKG
jgi:chromate reductase